MKLTNLKLELREVQGKVHKELIITGFIDDNQELIIVFPVTRESHIEQIKETA